MATKTGLGITRSQLEAGRKKVAASLKITAPDLLELKVIDEIIPEPAGGAHANHAETATAVRDAVLRHIDEGKVGQVCHPHRRTERFLSQRDIIARGHQIQFGCRDLHLGLGEVEARRDPHLEAGLGVFQVLLVLSQRLLGHAK